MDGCRVGYGGGGCRVQGIGCSVSCEQRAYMLGRCEPRVEVGCI